MWQAIIQGPLRDTALDVVNTIAERLRDPQRVAEFAALTAAQSSEETKRSWGGYSVSFGDAGLAFLFGQLDRCYPDQSWDRVAHGYLTTAGRSLESLPGAQLPPGLISGLAGLCFTTHYLSRAGTRYQRMLGTLDELLAERTSTTARLPDPFPNGVSFHDYDQISGPAGIGAYLLLRRDTPGIAAALAAVLDRLLFLSEWRDDGRLRMFIPPAWQPTPRHLEQYPQGATDCGLAHGVPGPLAALALAQLNGVERAGLVAAIRRLADWLVAQRCDDSWGINWPGGVPAAGDPRDRTPTKAGWCYGSPGVARALWLAGRALQDEALQALAVEALRAVRRRPSALRGIPSPIICHGVAGTLQIVLRFANDTGDPALVALAKELTEELLGLFDPSAPVGFRDVEFAGRLIDNPGLLNGAAGIALALLAATSDVEPQWDRMFLLA
jgi:hypothetical protein